MCSVDPDEVVEMTRVTDKLDINSGDVMCRKCTTEKAVVVLRIKDAYCRECFLSYFIHKFRSTIGKSKQIKPGDQVLIATSGGLSSSALLHLVREGLDETSHKKLRFEPAFLYIDESCLSENPDNGPALLNQVCSDVLSRNFQCYIISLEQVMATHPSAPISYSKDGTTELNTTPKLKQQLQQLITSCKSESAKQDLQEQLRQEVLYQCAVDLGYRKIFLGDNATTLSIRILTNVAVGRGSQLSGRVQFKAVHKDIEVYRPMREILQNEIQSYVDLYRISTIEAPSLKLKGSSIEKCTEEFIMGLQKEFPATIPTIFRTGDKLVSNSPDLSKCSTPDMSGQDEVGLNGPTHEFCVVCGLQLDTTKSESSAVHATVVSQKLSCRITPGSLQVEGQLESSKIKRNCADPGNVQSNDTGEEESSDATCDCSQQTKCYSSNKNTPDNSNAITKTTIESYICYGCRIIVRELGEVNHLPAKVRGFVAEQERRKQMRDQIQDFLL